jgi:hypothetical protein
VVKETKVILFKVRGQERSRTESGQTGERGEWEIRTHLYRTAGLPMFVLLEIIVINTAVIIMCSADCMWMCSEEEHGAGSLQTNL